MNIEKYCRVCTNKNAEMISIFDHYMFCEQYLEIFKVITKCASVQIQKLDGFSEEVCKRCIEHLCQAFSFKQLCEDSDYKFRHNLFAANEIVTTQVTKIQCAVVNNEIMEKLSVLRDVKSKVISEHCDDEIKTEISDEDLVEVEEEELDTPMLSVCGDSDCRSFEIKNEFTEEKPVINYGNENNEKTNQDEGNEEATLRHSSSSNKIKECERPSHLKKEVDYATSNNLTRIHMEKKEYKCYFCEKMFTEISRLVAHITQHMGGSHVLPKGNKLYKCKVCNKIFSEKGKLTAHLAVHTDRFKCDYCDKKFINRSHLIEHITKHTGDKPFECDSCQAKFATSSKLTRHKRTHTGEKPYQCDLCSKKFTENYSVIKHIRTHTTGKSKDKSFDCDFCKAKFATGSDLTRHVRIHTGEKPYKCDLCDKRFTQKSCLTTHIRTHTGGKPYKCEFCEKTFATSATINRHTRSIHRKTK